MKTLSRLAALLLVLPWLGACATTEKAAYRPAEPAPKPGSIVVDDAYVAYVQRVALRRGLTVKWVNQPTRRVGQ